MKRLTFKQKRNKLLEYINKYSLYEGKEYRLSSGQYSNFYVDIRRAMLFPQARKLLGEILVNMTWKDPYYHYVGGMSYGALPISTAYSDASYRMRNCVIPNFVVHKEIKNYGLKENITNVFGKLYDDDLEDDTFIEVLIVEDIMVTGRSLEKAINICRNRGYGVYNAIVILSRVKEIQQIALKNSVKIKTLFTLEDLDLKCSLK